jgi:pyruvate,water dikinase
LREKADWVIRQRGEIAATATMRQATDVVRGDRPDFDTIDDSALIQYVDGLLPLVSAAFTGHGTVSLGTSVAVGRLRDLLAEQDLTHLTMPLMSGLGGVESAGPTLAMWDLATSATADGLVDAVEAGEDGLASLRKGGPAAKAWTDRFDGFIAQYGARGQCEYDLITPSWETKPSIALGAIASMARQGIDRSSALEQSRARAVRDAAMSEARSALSGSPTRLVEFEQVLTAATVFMTAREAAKFPFVRMTNEVRVGIVALGRRLRARGAIEEPHDVAILLRSELGEAMDSPKLAAEIIAERKPKFEALFALDPPYIVTNAAPPLSQWRRRRGGQDDQAGPGTVLSGIAASPGTVTGRVRILKSAGDSHLLERGDVLVAPTTDAGWTPLLMVAGATVIEVGAIGSHGAIVSRELGIPSVVNCPRACSLLADGTKVEVNGSAGTVTVLAD